MKIKIIFSFWLFCILVGCSSVKNEHSPNPLTNGQIIRNGEALSEYFEAKAYTRNNEVLLHLIVTLGTERLPTGHEADLTWQDKKLKDRIESVEEVYISNKSEKPIVIANLSLSYFGKDRVLIDEAITIQPNSFFKTNAIISSTSLYRAEMQRTFGVKINGVQEVINIKERRTPVADLGKNI
jgi:hypothetical protein